MKLLLLLAFFSLLIPDEKARDAVADVVERQMELKPGNPMAVPAVPLNEMNQEPGLVLKIDAAGTLTGKQKEGKEQTFGLKGKPDFQALMKWLKELPGKPQVSVQVDGNALQQNLIGVINALNKAGIDKVTITDIGE